MIIEETEKYLFEMCWYVAVLHNDKVDRSAGQMKCDCLWFSTGIVLRGNISLMFGDLYEAVPMLTLL